MFGLAFAFGLALVGQGVLIRINRRRSKFHKFIKGSQNSSIRQIFPPFKQHFNRINRSKRYRSPSSSSQLVSAEVREKNLVNVMTIVRKDNTSLDRLHLRTRSCFKSDKSENTNWRGMGRNGPNNASSLNRRHKIGT